MNLIYLIGMPGSGKTTIGRELAAVLGLDFHDMDYMIELFEGKKISQIFEEDGEEHFRKVEQKILKDTGVFENAVVATGGGVPCFFDNIDFIKKTGKSVYLKVSPEQLTERVSKMEGRPLLDGKKDDELLGEISAKLEKRTAYYEQADFKVEGNDIQLIHVLEKLEALPWVKDKMPH